MKNLLLKIWKDPVWSKVIASVLFGGLVLLWSQFSATTFQAALEFLTSNYTLPVWVLAILIIISFFSIATAFVSLIAKRNVISNDADIVAVLDSWWPRASGMFPDDVHVNFSELEKKLNLQKGSVRRLIGAVAERHCYKPHTIGDTHGAYSYVMPRGFSG